MRKASRAAPWLSLRLVCLASAGAALLACPGHAEEPPAVAAIEAAYLTKFAPFIAWPDGLRGETATVCVAGDERMANEVQELGARAGGIAVRQIASLGDAPDCRVLFIGTAAVPSEMAAVALPVLTVTSEAPAGHRGIINFVVRDDRVRFEIDEAEAARHGLTISSKLLRLAVPPSAAGPP